jgi:hypothetical protein
MITENIEDFIAVLDLDDGGSIAALHTKLFTILKAERDRFFRRSIQMTANM